MQLIVSVVSTCVRHNSDPRKLGLSIAKTYGPQRAKKGPYAQRLLTLRVLFIPVSEWSELRLSHICSEAMQVVAVDGIRGGGAHGIR